MTRFPLVLAAALASAASLPAQRAHQARATIDSADVRVHYDEATESTPDLVIARISGSRPWPIGGAPGGLLSVGANYRLGNTVLPPGRYGMSLHRDRFGTWLLLRPLQADESPMRGVETARIPLEEQVTDTMINRMAIALERVVGTSETIVFGYDTASREVNRYSLHTESNRGLTRLVISWGDRRWGVPIMGVNRVAFRPQ